MPTVSLEVLRNVKLRPSSADLSNALPSVDRENSVTNPIAAEAVTKVLKKSNVNRYNEKGNIVRIKINCAGALAELPCDASSRPKVPARDLELRRC